MSRVGKVPVNVPEGVSVNFKEDGVVDFSGKCGKLSFRFPSEVAFAKEGNAIDRKSVV